MLFLALAAPVFSLTTDIVLSAPTNNSLSADTTPDFTFTPLSDSNATFTCIVYVDGASAGTNSSALNDTLTSITASSLAQGNQSWWIGCDDSTGEVNSSTSYLAIDTVAPVVSITSPLSGLNTSDTTPDVVFLITDVIDPTVFYTVYVDGIVDAGPLEVNNNTNTTVALAQGAHAVRVQAADSAGNALNSSSISIIVDTAGPTAAFATANNSIIRTTTLALQFTLSDATSSLIDWLVYLNDVPNASGTSANNTLVTANITNLAQENYSIRVQATDAIANVRNSSEIFVTLDTQSPSAAINAPANSTNTSDTTPTVTFTLVDTLSATLTYRVYVDGVFNGQTSTVANNSATPISLSAINGNGTHTLVVEATDAAGNSANSTQLTLLLDTNSPVATITSPANATNTSDSTPTISFTLTDETSSTLEYVLYVDGIQNGQAATVNNNTPTPLALNAIDGNSSHVVVVQVNDHAGNSANSTQLTISIDTEPPSVAIVSPGNNTNTSDTTPQIQFTAIDEISTELSYSFYVDGVFHGQSGTVANNTPTSINLQALNGNGTHTIVVEVLDNTGLYANSSQLVLSIDTIAPSVTFNNPANGTNISNATPEITFTLVDNTDELPTFRVYVDGVFYSQIGSIANNTPYPLELNPLSNGTHTLQIDATDVLGNRANSTQLTITVDTGAPAAVILTPANRTNTSDTTPAISVNLTDGQFSSLNYRVYVDGTYNGQSGTGTNASATPIVLSALNGNGTHTIVVEVTDPAGNAANSTALFLVINTATPTVVLNGPLSPYRSSDSTPQLNFTVTFAAGASASYVVYVDGSATGVSGSVQNNTLTNVNLASLSEGWHTVLLQATDDLGLAANSSSIIIGLDTTAPTSTFIAPANNSIQAANTISLSFSVSDATSSITTWTVFVNSVANASGSNNKVGVTIKETPIRTWDTSDQPFTITKGTTPVTPPTTPVATTLTVTTPNGGESFITGERIPVRWVSNMKNTDTATIYITGPSGSIISTLTTAPFKNGLAYVKLPNTPGNFKIMVSSGTPLQDTSDSTFAVTQAPVVTPPTTPTIPKQDIPNSPLSATTVNGQTFYESFGDVTPEVSSISRTSASSGDTITLTGKNFTSSGNTIYIDTLKGSQWSVDANATDGGAKLTFKVGAWQSGWYYVYVFNENGQSNFKGLYIKNPAGANIFSALWSLLF